MERLQIHLPNRHQVRYCGDQNINDLLNNEHTSKTMLTQYFALNARCPEARRYLYREIPEHYYWHCRLKDWFLRRSQKKVIGRIYTVLPSDQETFYLRLLINHIRGPTGFDFLLIKDGHRCATFIDRM